ncbi:MAG: hypothetical protein QNJ36_18440 [Calothrix sp. MO_167.B42]|nr:hypothetical protein [Calothrix sp. MO_167.B42]
MTNAENINARLDALTQRVNNLELVTGTFGTSQVAIAQIYSRLDNFADATNNNFSQISERFDRVEGRLRAIETTQAEHTEVLASHTEALASHTQLLNEILRILRDRNGGSGI